jgi:hypothetical protein
VKGDCEKQGPAFGIIFTAGLSVNRLNLPVNSIKNNEPEKCRQTGHEVLLTY